MKVFTQVRIRLRVVVYGQGLGLGSRFLPLPNRSLHHPPQQCDHLAHTVDGGHKAVMYNRINGVSNTVIGEGTHLKFPWFDRLLIDGTLALILKPKPSASPNPNP